MSKVPFTAEQIRQLRENPYTQSVTENTLILKEEFKELFYKEYTAGTPTREVFEKYGYPVSILGANRIDGIACCIRKRYREGTPGQGTDEKLRRLENEVEYLKQEVEFLKKISSIRNTGR